MQRGNKYTNLNKYDVPVFGTALAEARRARGLAASEVLARTGISQGNLARFETNRRTPIWQTLYLLIVACDFDLSYFFPEEMILKSAAGILDRRSGNKAS